MKYTIVAILAATLLGGTVLNANAQSAPQPAEAQSADQGDGQGGGWWGHRRGHGDQMGEGRGGHHGGGRMMRLIDANADGIISEDEAAAMADGQFQHLDQNQDGMLDKTEFASRGGHGRGMLSFLGLGADEAAAVQKVREEKFTALDTDKDSKLTKVEFFADAKAKLAAADADKDGKVSPWEFRAAN